MEIFHSRSKNLHYRYLSNFQTIQNGLTIPDNFIIRSIVGYTFPSVENAFQACKYAVSSLSVEPFLSCTPSEAKSMGSKKEA